MSTQEQRKRFEAWALAKGGYDRSDLNTYQGEYIEEHANTAFDAWIAAEAAAIERCASMVSVYLADHGIEQARECLPEAIRAMLSDGGASV